MDRPVYDKVHHHRCHHRCHYENHHHYENHYHHSNPFTITCAQGLLLCRRCLPTWLDQHTGFCHSQICHSHSQICHFHSKICHSKSDWHHCHPCIGPDCHLHINHQYVKLSLLSSLLSSSLSSRYSPLKKIFILVVKTLTSDRFPSGAWGPSMGTGRPPAEEHDKYINPFMQIHLAIWTNTTCANNIISILGCEHEGNVWVQYSLGLLLKKSVIDSPQWSISNLSF